MGKLQSSGNAYTALCAYWLSTGTIEGLGLLWQNNWQLPDSQSQQQATKHFISKHSVDFAPNNKQNLSRWLFPQTHAEYSKNKAKHHSRFWIHWVNTQKLKAQLTHDKELDNQDMQWLQCRCSLLGDEKLWDKAAFKTSGIITRH